MKLLDELEIMALPIDRSYTTKKRFSNDLIEVVEFGKYRVTRKETIFKRVLYNFSNTKDTIYQGTNLKRLKRAIANRKE